MKAARAANTTVTPPQALELLNNDLVLEWSRALAGRVLNDGGLSPEAAGGSRLPHRVLARARAMSASGARFPEAAVARFRHGRAERQSAAAGQRPAGMDPARAAAFVDLCQALLNSNEFVYMN